ncbi:hypothetical protein [Haloarchaeobius amylolyticus]|uniref:hypothetical protein n=1 Tax=Haloarchaeobius amylolyticus TaxID=1198296 RepID=UPI00226FB4E6|nr:hypothetical protein [Haloarchaeobius amylolyticus]
MQSRHLTSDAASERSGTGHSAGIGEAPRSNEASGTDPGRRELLLYPAYGPVEAVLGFVMFYVVVDHMTPVVVSALAGPLPGFVPEPATTVAAIFLWFILGLSLFGMAQDQLRENPRRFASRAQREEFLAQNRPTRSSYAYHLVVLVVGGLTAALAWETFLEVLEALMLVPVEGTGLLSPAVGPVEIAIFVVFTVTFAAFSRAADRLAIGALRDVGYRVSRR